MNNVTSARLYFLFALLLCLLGWKVCHEAATSFEKVSANRNAQIERILSSAN